MQLDWAGVRASGAVLDLRDESVSATAVMGAVRDPTDDRLRCRPPGPVAERVGVVSRSITVPVRTLVALALRTHGVQTPYDRALARAEWRRARVEIPDTDLAAARAAVAGAEGEVDAMREEVARLGGRVDALREDGGDVEAAAAELQAAVTRLSELETEQVAAEQRLATARERARAMRDARDRRRAFGDRADNLRREARDWLVEWGYDRFRGAVAAVAEDVDAGDGPASFGGPDWVAAVAALRLAREPGPAVLGADLPVGDVATVQQVVGRPVIVVEV